MKNVNTGFIGGMKMPNLEKPVTEGGNPVRKDYLIFGKPEIRTEEIDEVVRVLKSGWLSTGPMVQELEEKISNYIGCKYTLAVNSCTAALHLSLICNEIGKNDEVIVSPLTFAASVNVIEHVGAKPKFVDVEKDSFNIDAEKIVESITPKTKAVMPVHFGGLPCDMDAINKIAYENELIVIEDAAHAIGAEFKSQKIGSQGNPTCFSFYPTKNITAGEGGVICLNDEDIAEMIKIYSNHGLSKHAWRRYSKEGEKTYNVIYPGYKYNMQDINAAIVTHQLDRIEEIIHMRKKYANSYFKAFKDLDLIELPPDKSDRKNTWHLFPILLNLEKLRISRNEFMAALHEENIGSGIHYGAIHLQPYYKKKYGFNNGMFKRVEYISERTISIPFQTSMSEEDLFNVVSAVKKILYFYEK